MKVGLPTEINLIIGDNDAEEYIFPFIKSFSFNKSLYKERQLQYKEHLKRNMKIYLVGTEDVSFGLLLI